MDRSATVLKASRSVIQPAAAGLRHSRAPFQELKAQSPLRPFLTLTWLLPAVVCATILGGCAVGPNYHRPAVDAPANFRGQSDAATNSLAELAWWNLYQDETLRDLIHQALTNNYDARIAITRVEQAHQLSAQARAAFFPQIGYEGVAARGRRSSLGRPTLNNNPGGPSPTTSGFLADFNAVWEVDLFGRVRRANEVVRAQYLATEEAQRGVRIMLQSQVAMAYFRLLELDRLLEIAQRSTNTFGQTLQVFNERLRGGVASQLETSRAEAALASAAATLPELRRQIMLTENQLNVLLGRNPGPVTRTTSLLQELLPPAVPAGLPSALLERRPDVREAEQNLRAANATIGLAIGGFFPRIGLTALYGGVSPELSTLTSGSANAWAVAANVSGPLFSAGKNYAQYRQARAVRDEAQLRYQQAALNAFQEVSNALLSREQFAETRAEQERAVRAYEESVTVSLQRYRAGKASYFEVLEAQQQLLPAEYALAQTRLNQLVVVVQLYEALGGGWSEPVTETK